LSHAPGRAVPKTRQVSEVQNEIGEKAGPATCHYSGSMRPDSNENRFRRFVILITTRSLAAFLTLSFLATLLPAGAVAAKSIMACCTGKNASHCHAGLKTKKTTAVSSSCQSDCCAYCAPAQQTKRERSAAHTVVKLTSPIAVPCSLISITVLVPARAERAPVSPRGPPTFFVEQIS
jgi:hypothetical protein